jgi:hypothetical protein
MAKRNRMTNTPCHERMKDFRQCTNQIEVIQHRVVDMSGLDFWLHAANIQGLKWRGTQNLNGHLWTVLFSVYFVHLTKAYFGNLWKLTIPIGSFSFGKSFLDRLWSSGSSFWPQIQSSLVRFLALPDFLRSRGSGTGSTQPREDNWGATW